MSIERGETEIIQALKAMKIATILQKQDYRLMTKLAEKFLKELFDQMIATKLSKTKMI